MNYFVVVVYAFLIPFFAHKSFASMQQIGALNMEADDRQGVQFVTLDNGFQVWTRRVGEGKIKLLLLHGGPGYTHECFECFEEFFPKDEFQLVYYDQLGSYYSDQPEDPSLWTIERFCQEAEQVRQALGLEDFYLYGFSWGGMLAIEYVINYQHHLKGLILSNMPVSASSYEAYVNELRNKLPAEVIDQFVFYESRNDLLHPEYEKLLFKYIYQKYICRLDPWPEPVLKGIRHFNKAVCDEIFGPNEFVITGNCKSWDRWSDLVHIHVPTLVIGGRYDTINPKDIEKAGTLIPNAKVKICENGSHLSMYDDQKAYFTTLLAFLKDLD